MILHTSLSSSSSGGSVIYFSRCSCAIWRIEIVVLEGGVAVWVKRTRRCPEADRWLCCSNVQQRPSFPGSWGHLRRRRVYSGISLCDIHQQHKVEVTSDAKVRSGGESRYCFRWGRLEVTLMAGWKWMKEDRCSITMVTKRCVILLLYCHKWENAAPFTLQTVLKIPKCLPLIHFLEFKFLLTCLVAITKPFSCEL